MSKLELSTGLRFVWPNGTVCANNAPNMHSAGANGVSAVKVSIATFDGDKYELTTIVERDGSKISSPVNMHESHIRVLLTALEAFAYGIGSVKGRSMATACTYNLGRKELAVSGMASSDKVVCAEWSADKRGFPETLDGKTSAWFVKMSDLFSAVILMAETVNLVDSLTTQRPVEERKAATSEVKEFTAIF